MEIIPLSEGSFTIDRSKEFIPFTQGKDDLGDRSKGSLLVEIQPFVLLTSEDILLLDTGLGFSHEGQLQLHQNLLRNGIRPESVTKVLLTHLHKDHAGGISRSDGSASVLSFPQAKYYVQRQELNFAFRSESPSYDISKLQVLSDDPQVILLDGEGVIDGYIRYQLTGAHSLFHQVFWVVDGGMKVFFGGDEAPQLQQMKSRFVAKYDHDGKRSMELRQEWRKKGEEEQWHFLFYHDIKTPHFCFT